MRSKSGLSFDADVSSFSVGYRKNRTLGGQNLPSDDPVRNGGAEPSLPRNFPCYFSESNFRWRPFADDISNLTDKGSQMNLFSIRVITENVEQMTAFYETVTGVPRTQSQPVFAEIFTDQGILAIGNSQTLSFFDGVDSIKSATNRSMILEFKVSDVDAEYERLAKFLEGCVAQAPKMMPWGNKSLLFWDPDGNLVNMFATVSPEAKARWGD